MCEVTAPVPKVRMELGMRVTKRPGEHGNYCTYWSSSLYESVNTGQKRRGLASVRYTISKYNGFISIRSLPGFI